MSAVSIKWPPRVAVDGDEAAARVTAEFLAGRSGFSLRTARREAQERWALSRHPLTPKLPTFEGQVT
ncbi:MAG: hypothetical protein KDB53_00490 [Planctomycetes bacterium]|nr:hypothetical protein [Planctomycetota bacterium]